MKLISSFDISEPLDLEFQTTNFRKQFPNLSEEVVAASTVFTGNFSSVHADIIERYEMMISKVIYILVGLAAIYEIATHKRNCKHCMGGQMNGGQNM